MSEKLKLTLIIIGLFLLMCLGIICVGWSIYAFVKYGNKPITEIPAWALWFMFRGGSN